MSVFQPHGGIFAQAFSWYIHFITNATPPQKLQEKNNIIRVHYGSDYYFHQNVCNIRTRLHCGLWDFNECYCNNVLVQ